MNPLHVGYVAVTKSGNDVPGHAFGIVAQEVDRCNFEDSFEGDGIFDHPRPDAARHDVVVVGSADAIAAARVSHHTGIAEIEMALQFDPNAGGGSAVPVPGAQVLKMAQHHDPARLDKTAVAGQTRSSSDAAISINGRHDVSITGQPKGHIVVPEIAGGFDIARRTHAGAGVVRAVIVPGRSEEHTSEL